MEKGHLQSKCMHHLYEFEMLFPVIQRHAEKKTGFLGGKNNMFETLRVRQVVTPKREQDRKSPDKLHPRQTYTLLVQYYFAQNNNLTVNLN